MRTLCLLLILLFGSVGLAAQEPSGSSYPQPDLSGVRTCVHATILQRSQCSGDRASIPWSECQEQCVGCCNNFGDLNGWSELIVDTMCNCLVEAGTSPAGFAACAEPQFLLELFLTPGADGEAPPVGSFEEAMQLLNEIYEAVSDSVDLSQESLDAAELLQYLPPELQAQVRRDILLRTLSWLKIGASLLESTLNICGHVGEWLDDEYEASCRTSCQSTFPVPTVEPPNGNPDPGGDPDTGGPGGPGGPGGNPGRGDNGNGPNNPLDRPCLGTVGQSCTVWDNGTAHWGTINDYCDCEATFTSGECYSLNPLECLFPGGGGLPWWLVVQWY